VTMVPNAQSSPKRSKLLRQLEMLVGLMMMWQILLKRSL